MHHQVDNTPAGRAFPTEPGVLDYVHGEPIRAQALPSVAAYWARPHKLSALPPKFDAAVVDFIDNRRSTRAGDGFGIGAASHNGLSWCWLPARRRHVRHRRFV
jgi:hypothetical protein